MNPLAYTPRQQAKAIVAALGAMATTLTSGGDWRIGVLGTLVSFYATFATSN